MSLQYLHKLVAPAMPYYLQQKRLPFFTRGSSAAQLSASDRSLSHAGRMGGTPFAQK